MIRITHRQFMLFATLLALVGSISFGMSPIASIFAQGDPPPPPPPADPPPSPPSDPLPPPPSVGSEIPTTYFGPPPSEALIDPRDHALVGPVQLLKAGRVDAGALTITLPLYRGQMPDGRPVWYILTDTTDKANADSLGLNFSAKLLYANTGRAVRVGRLERDTSLTFLSGAVDFAPVRAVVPGDAPNFFPPKQVQPGSVGDGDYTPLVRIENAGNHIYNAPVVAFGVGADQINFCNGNPDYSKVHVRVVSICPNGGNGEGTVTLKMTPIFSFARPVTYISMEASDPVPAVLDNATFAPALGDVAVGRDDSFASAVERLFVTVNGPTGGGNPQRQGLNSALSDKDAQGNAAPPLHVIGGVPTIALDYSPLWDINLGFWTQSAIDQGYRSRMIDEFQYLSMVQQGFITGMNGAPFGSSGIVVNCPIVMRFL